MPARPTIPAGSGLFLTGDKQLLKKFAQMPDALQRKALRPGTRELAKKAKDHAARIAPEDTGALAASLKVRSAATSYTTKQGKRRRIRKFRDMVGHGVFVGDGLFKGDQFYAGFLEFGTEPRQTKSGASRGRILEQEWAFLRPALYAQAPYAVPVLGTHVRRFMRSQQVASGR